MKRVDFLNDAILPLVEHPSRYIDSELNLTCSGFGEDRFNILLAFPDSYEIGMSHQGIRYLYHFLSRVDGVGVEFAFAPWPDLERFLGATSEPLRSQQTGTSIRRFDLVGFSLTYELHYTNLLMMLELSGIPLLSAERGDDDPLVIAGGPACTNPLPFINAIDAIFVGDAEESLIEAVERLKALKAGGAGRAEKLSALSEIEGVYVDCLSESVKSRVYIFRHGDLPVKSITPASHIIHNRLSVEVMRGCTRGCRFCHAGIFYRPRRERSVEEVSRAVIEGIKSSGWPEVSLLSLSTSDYSKLGPLLDRISLWLSDRNVSLAMPSLRPETVSELIVSASGAVRRSGFTLAPEAGTERLRRAINKWISDEEILEGCRKILGAGWQNLKLYFMIGLPTETQEDLDGIVELVERILSLPRTSRRFRLAVSISPFVPKPHTPFQWERQNSIEEISEKEHYIASRLRSRRVMLSLRDPRFSILEGILSRGDRGMWNVLLSAYRAGCRFDGWSDRLRFDLWEEALEENGYELEDLLAERDTGEPLPWDFIDLGVTRSFLLLERKRSREAVVTEDCRVSKCTGCGACDGESAGNPEGVGVLDGQGDDEHKDGGQNVDSPDGEGIEAGTGSPESTRDVERGTEGNSQISSPAVPPVRYRLVYEKTSRARFLSHTETLDCLRRAIRMSGIPVRFTEGFNPHPRLSAGPPLPVGMEGLREYLDIELLSACELSPGMFNDRLPEGIRIKEIAGPFSRKQGKLPLEFTQYYLFTFDVPDRIAAAMLDALTRNGAPETEKPRLLSKGKATGAVSRWLKLADALGILPSLSSNRDGSGSKTFATVLESLISPHAIDRIRGVVDRVVEELAKERAIDMSSLCGLLLRRMTADGFGIEDRKGRMKNLSLCTVTRVVPGERLEVAIDSGPGSPTAFEVLSSVLSRELVPLVRVVRLSTKYRLNGELLDVVQVVSKKTSPGE